jgi:ribosomal protein S19E (S16A)
MNFLEAVRAIKEAKKEVFDDLESLGVIKETQKTGRYIIDYRKLKAKHLKEG